MERLQEAFRSFRDHALETTTDSQVLGLSVRVVHDGVWGFAAGITLTADSRRPAGRAGGGHGPGLAAADPGPVRAGRRAGLRRRDLGVGVRGQPLRRSRGGPVRPDAGAERAAARRARRSATPTPTWRSCRRTSSSPTWPAPRPPSSGSGSRPSSPRSTSASTASRPCGPRCRRSGRGWEYLTGTGWDFDARDRRAGRAAGRPRRRAVGARPAATTWSSTRPTCG